MCRCVQTYDWYCINYKQILELELIQTIKLMEATIDLQHNLKKKLNGPKTHQLDRYSELIMLSNQDWV